MRLKEKKKKGMIRTQDLNFRKKIAHGVTMAGKVIADFF